MGKTKKYTFIKSNIYIYIYIYACVPADRCA